MTRFHRFQRGFAAIAAIFLVVVLAALGGFMLTFSNTQQLTSAQDIQGSRAYWAARAGLEWGIASVAAVAACPATSTTFTVDAFSVVVSCAATAYTEAATPVNIYRFTSVASSSGAVGSAGYIERSLSASMER
jgi:MSHA biogenesis protein MshP